MTSKLATTKAAALFVTAGVIMSVFAFATSAKADSVSDLQAQIAALTAQIAALSGGSHTTTTSSACFTFTTNLKLGSKGAEVMQLQKLLNSSADTQVASVGAGSSGNETTTFGPATKKAVIKFQEKYAADILTPVGLTAGTGNWGAGSRAKANSLCGPTNTNTTTTTTTTTPGGVVTPTGAGVSVVAATQPVNTLAPLGASRVPFTTITLTNTSGAAVTVNGITVQRTGLAADGAFSGVILVDQNGMQMGVSRTFDSNHQATVGDTFTLAAGASATYTVAANLVAKTDPNAALYGGQVAAISVVGVNTSVPVAGSLPISGAQQTINGTLTMGTVTTDISSFDPNSSQTKHIGDTAVRFVGARFTAGSAEDLKFYSIRFRINGSIGSTDLANAVVVVNGTSYPAVVSADGRYYAAMFPGGILITKGNSVDAYLQADIVGNNASGRTAEFDIDRTYDAYFVGQTYGYGIQPVAPTNVALLPDPTHASEITSSQPYFQGSTISIQGGAATTIQNSPSVPAQNIAINVANQVLGGMDVNFIGEPVTVQSMTFSLNNLTGWASSTDKITSVSLVDQNGSVVAGPVDQDSSGNVVFGNSVTFPVGAHTYTLRGRLPASSDYSNGTLTSIQFKTDPTNGWTGVQGQTTGNSLTLGVSLFTMNTMTVRGSSLALSVSGNPSAQTIVAGGQNILFTNIQLDASQSGEDVRVTSLPVLLTLGSPALRTDLSACQVYNGSTALNTGSNVMNSVSAGENTFTLDNPFVITKGTVATLGVECNLSSAASTTGTYAFGLGSTTTAPVSGTGAISGNTVSATISPTSGSLMTVAGKAGLVLNVDYSSPAFTVSAGGTTGVIAGVYHLRASNEAVNLQKVGLKLDGGSVNDLSQVYLYNSSNQLIGTAVFTSGGSYATSTLSTPLNLPKDTDVTITVKADLAAIGTGMPGSITGDIIKIDPINFDASGVSSGSDVTGVSDLSQVAGVQAFRSFPTIALGTLPSNGVSDGRLIHFSVTADSHGAIGLARFAFAFASSSVAIPASSIQLYAYTDAGYSTPASTGQTGGLVNLANNVANATSTVVTVNNALGAIEVPAGQTYYFELRSSSISGSGTSYNLATTLLGDASSVSLATAPASTANFVWSQNALGTSATTTADWTGGAGLVGLSSSGIVQNRTN